MPFILPPASDVYACIIPIIHRQPDRYLHMQNLCVLLRGSASSYDDVSWYGTVAECAKLLVFWNSIATLILSLACPSAPWAVAKVPATSDFRLSSSCQGSPVASKFYFRIDSPEMSRAFNFLLWQVSALFCTLHLVLDSKVWWVSNAWAALLVWAAHAWAAHAAHAACLCHLSTRAKTEEAHCMNKQRFCFQSTRGEHR